VIITLLKLIRYKNLGILALSQILIKYFFLNKYNSNIQLTLPLFLILLFSILFLAAAGYIINDIYDIEIDKINKPYKVIIGNKISEKYALKLYVLFNIIGLGLAYYLSYTINHLSYALIFLGTAFCLLKYAQSWKNIFFIKNFLVAFLVSISILILGLFDILPGLNNQNTINHFIIVKIISFYFLFSFLTNYIREIIKDIEDVNGDKIRNTQSFISKIGLDNTKIIIYVLNGFLILFLGYFISNYFTNNILSLIYIIIFVFIPSIFYFVLLIKAKTIKNYSIVSKLLKLIMIFGITSILFLKL